jgi:hypothetical protein
MPVDAEAAKKRVEKLKARIQPCVKMRDKRVTSWKDSVQSRIGKAFDVAPADDTINVPADWSRTKNKIAQLFFQVPAIQARPLQPQFAGAAPAAASSLNWILRHDVKAHVVMKEILSDVINAAGIGIAKIGYDAAMETTQVPAKDMAMYPPETHEQLIASGLIEMVPQERTVYECYYASRVAPQFFLWPAEFTGSDFQECAWLGHEGWMPVAEAVRLGWVEEGFKSGSGDPDYLTDDKSDRKSDDEFVHFYEIFERVSVYNPAEKNHDKLRRIVLVEGKDDAPAVDEDFKWQRYDDKTRRYMGLRNFPLKVVTLTYVSDMALPPSDTEMGRPQVQELSALRSSGLQQRRHSKPVRWFDSNMVDEDVADQLRRGVWQDFIPMNGPGDNAIGEVARASYPRENHEYNNYIQADLDEVWSSGANQAGSFGQSGTTAEEVRTVQGNANLRLEYERGCVLRFFQEIAEGIFALMQLFQTNERYAETIGPDGAKALQTWDRNTIAGDFIFEIAPDAAQRVDIGARRTEIQKMFTLVRQDSMVNAEPLLREWFSLNGFDPATCVVKPQPQPDKPNIGFSFKGEDLANPIAVAVMQKSGMQVTEDEITAAKKMIIDAGGNPLPPAPQPPTSGAPGAPAAGPHEGTPPVVEPITKRFESGESAI